MNKQLRIRALAMCGWFFLFLALPAVQSVFHLVPEGELTENRNLAKLPEPGLRATYTRELQDYWNDHFGFRLRLGVASARITYALGESPNSHVVLGKNGWLYYYDNLTEESGPGELRITSAAASFLAYQEWLANRGIVFFLVLPLDKHSMYPEYLPDHLEKVESIELYRRFRALLAKNHIPINLVDVSDVCFAWKQRGQLLYLADDNHWNELGGLVGATEMTAAIARVYPTVHPHPMSDYEWTEGPVVGGDLASMTSLPKLFTGTTFTVHPRFTPRAKFVDAGLTLPQLPPNSPQLAMEVADPSLPRAFFFRDSFMDRSMVPLGENFRHSLYVWNANQFISELIERDKPDFVVYQRIERDIGNIEAPRPPIATELAVLARRKQAFAASTAVVQTAAGVGDTVHLPVSPPSAAEQAQVPVLEVSGSPEMATVLDIDGGDGTVYRRVLYPGANRTLLALTKWPSSVGVTKHVGQLTPASRIEITLKAVDPHALADPAAH